MDARGRIGAALLIGKVTLRAGSETIGDGYQDGAVWMAARYAAGAQNGLGPMGSPHSSGRTDRPGPVHRRLGRDDALLSIINLIDSGFSFALHRTCLDFGLGLNRSRGIGSPIECKR